MSSFKRRGASAAAATAWPPGVRPSSFSSPVPLVSTGVPALDDILSGGGLSSGSLFTILPTTATAALSAAQIGSAATTAAARAESDHIARAAAEPYAELILAYAVAQGIAAKHRGLAIGEDVDTFSCNLMARAGDLEDKELQKIMAEEAASSALPPATSSEDSQPSPSERLGIVPDEDEDGGKGLTQSQRDKKMKIAWRYEKMNQFKTTVDESAKGKDESEAFCSTFDLSRRISPRILQKAKADGVLDTLEIDLDDYDPFSSGPQTDGNSFELAFSRIRKKADECLQARNALPTSPPPVLRVSIRSLGSPCWKVARAQRVETELIRFLTRLKALLRSLAVPDAASGEAGSSAAANLRSIPAVAIVTLSPYVVSAIQPSTSARPSPGASANLMHRVAHVSDACISLSAFAPSPGLRAAFPSYTGALKVLKTPALGTLTNPSIRASVLRGMGAGAAQRGSDSGSLAALSLGSSGSVGEGGAGGGENNLAFKVRRKRLVIETLHLDVEGGVSERRTKPPKNMDEGKVGAAAGRAAKTTVGGQDAKPAEAETGAKASGSFQRHPLQPAAAAASAPAPVGQAAPPMPPKFGGLKSLRARGLAASNRATQAASATATTAAPSSSSLTTLEVELDTGRRPHPHPHPHPHLHPHPHDDARRQQPARRGPVFKSDRLEDYEF
ncbi:Elongator subunit elp4 [Thecaphora frezii]